MATKNTALIQEYRILLKTLEEVYRDFEAGITAPTPVPAGKQGMVMRMPTQDVHHAIILKLAAMLQFLNSALVLCEAGLVLGQGALERMADEAGEDVMFLTVGLGNGMADRQEEFLDYFWREDFADFDDIPNSFQSRPQLPREKVIAGIHRLNPDPSTGSKVSKVVAKSYSGFVHAAAPHVMEIYDARSNTFGVSGAPDYRQVEHIQDLWNYIYRGTTAMMAAAKAFGSDKHFEALEEAIETFQERTERNGGYRRKGQA